VLWRTSLDVFDFDAIAAVASCEHTATRKIVLRAPISNALSAEFAPALGRFTTCFIEQASDPYHSGLFGHFREARAS
jgi:hypothetical protein